MTEQSVELQTKAPVPFRLTITGESSVGKSSLILRYVRNQFQEFLEPTIGASFLTHTVPLDESIVKFEIWDVAGNERYRSLAPVTYRRSDAAIVVYDITDYNSFSRAKGKVKELQVQYPSIVIALAGNKQDLDDRRKVDTAEARAYADENGILFTETSAKTAHNVAEVFADIANQLLKDHKGGHELEGINVMPKAAEGRGGKNIRCC